MFFSLHVTFCGFQNFDFPWRQSRVILRFRKWAYCKSINTGGLVLKKILCWWISWLLVWSNKGWCWWCVFRLCDFICNRRRLFFFAAGSTQRNTFFHFFFRRKVSPSASCGEGGISKPLRLSYKSIKACGLLLRLWDNELRNRQGLSFIFLVSIKRSSYCSQ